MEIRDHGSALRWLGFFGLVLGAWLALFAMQPAALPPPAWADLGLDYLAALCVTRPADASLAGLVAMWALMSAAMMAPTAIPAFKTYDDLTHTEAAGGLGFAGLVGGYLLAWLGFSVLAAMLQLWLGTLGALEGSGRSVWPWFNAGLLAAAGLYQFSRVKAACLSKCRRPFMFFMESWRPGAWGAARMGLWLGAVCVGCCWLLMLLGFVGGVMSLAWMGLAMVLMILEKLPALGRHVTKPLGGLLLLAAAWMALGAI